jgi:2-(1,2-epoxy-1,2-dihydrophenyl)acetyl-CoA isomerase
VIDPDSSGGAADAPTGVVVEQSGGVMTIVLDRAVRKNALTAGMIRAITDSIRRASHDDDTRVVLVRANGVDFCTGIDLAQSNAPSGDHTRPRAGHLQRRLGGDAHAMILAFESAQVPIVAAVRGWAAGVGNMLALSADVVVADSTAKFWVPFVTKGFTPDSGNTWLLPRLVGVARAKEMILRGKPIDGARAAEWGLISRCVEPGELDRAVDEVVHDLAAAATVSVGLARTMLHQNLSVGLAAALQNEAIHEELAVRSDDFKEGMRAFAEKRPPEFTGR